MSQSADQHSHSFLNGDAKTIDTYSPSWRCQDVCRKTSSGSILDGGADLNDLNACKCRFHQISWLYFTNFGLLTFFFCMTGDVYNGWSLTTFWCRNSPPIVTYVLSSLICFEKVIWNDISRKEIQLVIHGTVLLMALWIVWEIFLYQLWHSKAYFDSSFSPSAGPSSCCCWETLRANGADLGGCFDIYERYRKCEMRITQRFGKSLVSRSCLVTVSLSLETAIQGDSSNWVRDFPDVSQRKIFLMSSMQLPVFRPIATCH